jgi:3',5'-cyclic AMP phosphodiesterase CpdA
MNKNNNSYIERELYTKTVEYINRTKPAFVVITGDFVNIRTDMIQINAFKEITAMIDPKIPVYLTPGNHDIGIDPTDEEIDFYLKLYGYDRFRFNHGRVCFVGLNSCYIKAGSPQEQEQLEWVRTVFSSNKSLRKVIFLHHPFFAHDINEEEAYFNLPIEKRKDYFRLFKENNAIAVFAGHHHNNASAEYDGIDMITTSSVGKQLGNVKSGFREITVYPDSITHKYLEINNIR